MSSVTALPPADSANMIVSLLAWLGEGPAADAAPPMIATTRPRLAADPARMRPILDSNPVCVMPVLPPLGDTQAWCLTI